MEKTVDVNALMTDSLRAFFSDATLVSLADPLRAVFFAQTVWRQRKAARVRRAWGRRGLQIPPIMICSVTHRCNLRCKGCYAQAQHPSPGREMDEATLRRVIGEARDLGISFHVIAGGEPLIRPGLVDILAAHPDVIFFVFTNGLLIDEAMAARFARLKNIVPILSVEGCEAETDARRGAGVHGRVTTAMRALKAHHVFFGVSCTVTRATFPVVTEPGFVRGFHEAGCRLFMYLEYVPVTEATAGWVVTDEQRAAMPAAVHALRGSYPALYVSVPGDEEKFGGCLSAGRGFVHVSPEGSLEPCPFVPYSDASVADHPLREALASKFLATIRAHGDELDEGRGGCALWNRRAWLQSLLEPGAARETA